MLFRVCFASIVARVLISTILDRINLWSSRFLSFIYSMCSSIKLTNLFISVRRVVTNVATYAKDHLDRSIAKPNNVYVICLYGAQCNMFNHSTISVPVSLVSEHESRTDTQAEPHIPRSVRHTTGHTTTQKHIHKRTSTTTHEHEDTQTHTDEPNTLEINLFKHISKRSKLSIVRQMFIFQRFDNVDKTNEKSTTTIIIITKIPCLNRQAYTLCTSYPMYTHTKTQRICNDQTPNTHEKHA